MSSRMEDKKNEKIIRGLMKLPPNRRCINCNSMGPQYVCTNFWTFVCTTCSGIHREFTHRVKSVSMAKFTSQEVDFLQKGGNQRARELYLKAWDLPRQRHPDNSNVDKVRDFIKSVYVKKMYAVEKSPDRPPRDPQGLRNYEDETRRASSYHSYSQSPPYDFQYEERRYGKHAPSLSRRPGSDRGIYEGKFSAFSSPSRLSDRANDDMFASDDSNPRASDCSASVGGDLFRSSILTPSSQRDTGSPFRDNLKGISSEVSRNDIIIRNSDVDSWSNGGRLLHPQRTASLGSFGSFDSGEIFRTASLGSFGSFDSDSISFKSVNSLGLPEVDPEQSAKIFQDKSTSFPSYMQTSANENFEGLDLFAEPLAQQNVSSLPLAGIDSQLQTLASGTFGGLDLFAETIVPQNFTSAPPTYSNSQLRQPSLTQSVSSISTFADQQMSRTPQTSSVDLSSQLPPKQLTESSHGKISDGVVPNNGGWASFDIAQTVTTFGMDKLGTTIIPASDQNTLGNFNPFSYHQSAYSSAGHEPATLSPIILQEGLESVETTTKSTDFWNTFEDSAGQQPIPSVRKNNNHFDVEVSLGFVASEVMNNDGNPRVPNETSSFSLSSHSLPLNDISVVSAVAGLHSAATDHKASNPFDLPYDTDMESDSMFWDISSLQAALPTSRNSVPYIGDVNRSWFPQNPIPSYVPGAFDHPTGSLGLIAVQTPNTHLSNISSQAPVGGNPFA